MMMASMIPWAQFRQTYGEPIDARTGAAPAWVELAGLIVGVRRSGAVVRRR